MTHLPFLTDLLVVFLVGGIVVFLVRPLAVPPLVGLLVAGAVVGPHGLSLVRDTHDVETLAEIGIVVLLFTIGMEFSLRSLLRTWRTLVGAGGGQMLATIAVTSAVFVVFVDAPAQAVFFGFLVALSSTAIVLRLVADRAEIESPHGRVTLGILLFQDLCVVPLVLLTPFLAGTGGGGTALVRTLLLAGLVVAGVLLAARYLIPPVLRAVVRAGSRELFLISLCLLCMGTAWVTSLAGLSLALGAFLAGLSLSESEYGHQAMAEVLPFRDVFGVLFFVSIGMLLDVRFVVANLPLALGATAALVAIKSACAALPVLVLGHPVRVALWVGLALAQVGEFAFVLAQGGVRAGLLSADQYQVFLAASVLSMLATPGLFALADLVAQRTSAAGVVPWHVGHLPVDPVDFTPLDDHVVVVGYGLNGTNVACALDAAAVRYVVLDLNPDKVREARAAGRLAVFGDSTRPSLLEHVGVARARVLVIAISDAAATRRTVAMARTANPGIDIVVRTRFVSEVEQLRKLGADEVIPEEFETSIEIFSRVLEHYAVPQAVVLGLTDRVRSGGYDMLRHASARPHGASVRLPGVDVETVKMAVVDHAVGRSLGELELRRRTGASVLSVERAGTPIGNPGADFRAEAGDVLVLSGARDAIERAIGVLREGVERPSAQAPRGPEPSGA